MGIGNTTSASALVAALLGAEPRAVCGRGTGIDDEGLARKVEAVGRALEVNRPRPADGLGTLAALLFGGTLDLTTAGLIGSVIGSIIVLLIWRAMGGERTRVA